MRIKSLTFIVMLLSNDAQAFLFGYDNYDECTNDKEAEYIDKGSDTLNAFSRARGYCDKKFPVLPPKYKQVSGITGKWGEALYSINKYEIVLDKPCAKISFIATMENGKNKKYYDVTVSSYPRYKVSFETPLPTKEITITETFINLNRDKRKGD